LAVPAEPAGLDSIGDRTGRSQEVLRRFALVFVLALVGGLTIVAPVAAASKHTYTQNFNDYPQGEWLHGSAISSWEITYAKHQCGGTLGCQDWWIIGYIKPTGGLQNGLAGGQDKGLIHGRFTYPVTSIAIIAQPAVQFNAVYSLTAFGRDGHAVGKTTVVHNGDQDLPGFDGFGYFPMALTHLRAPACSFTIASTWLAATSPFYRSAAYEVGTITVRLENSGQAHRCG
jgi:hypothetical protein